jgi:hypothetical protein
MNNSSAYRSTRPARQPAPKRRRWPRLLALLVVLAAAFVSFRTIVSSESNNVAPQSSATPIAKVSPSPSPTPTPINYCGSNTLDKLALVSVSKRHMWACEGTQTMYDSPVITGMEFLAADLTPRGTYHVYSKTTDTRLRGSDSTGSWDRAVYYWMPFLHNQYGTYGFHDATWRPDSDFGNIDPNTSDASHGCVELPLAATKWLYEWAPNGTTVTVVD